MAWCLNCEARVAPLVTECPECQAQYSGGQGWSPLPESEAEEAAQAAVQPLWSDAFAGSDFPPYWKVTRNAECVRVADVVEPKSVKAALPMVLSMVLAMAVGAAVTTFVYWGTQPMWVHWMTWSLPLLPLALVLLPGGRRRREWTIFSSGEVFETNGRRKRAHKLGAPVSILLEPFDRSGSYAPPPQSPEARLVARGPLGFVVITHDTPYALRTLRDEIRGQRPGTPPRASRVS